MEDPETINEAAEQQRQAEAAMEAFLRAQEEEEEDAFSPDERYAGVPPHAGDEGNIVEGDNNENGPQDFGQPPQQQQQQQHNEADAFPDFPQEAMAGGHFAVHPELEPRKPFRLSYVTTSFLVAFCMVYYALRTRQQFYLALVFLSSSKWAYIVLGNAFVASLISIFSIFTRVFLNGLRLHEAEGLGDFFRWNITETCLALTMFRTELNVQTGILFLILVLAKCLHWVADMREGHLRMTQEAIIAHPTSGYMALQWPHFKLICCLGFLQFLDVIAVLKCGHDILTNGPSVSILFAFESAILLVTAMSSILLWFLHVMDGVFNYWHETTTPGHWLHGWVHPWKDHKATLVFAVEVQAQAAKFLFYTTFFAIVMTYYGLPINLFREVYVSFQSLRQRLVAFAKYRQLMANMNQFSSPTEEELEEAGTTCIICRDEMTVQTTKKLPGCGHIFHKSCLREWLVQQQTCPTCRGDISTMQARQRQQDQANERQQARETEPEEAPRDAGDNEPEAGGDSGGAADSNDGSNHNQQFLVANTSGEPSPHGTAPEKVDGIASAPITNGEGDSSAPVPADRSAPGETEGAQPETVSSTASAAAAMEETFPEDLPHAFPAFYRVVQGEGAAVYNAGELASSFIIRLVPRGVVIVGQELAWRNCEGHNRLMIRMPDGWICDEQLERITAVPMDFGHS